MGEGCEEKLASGVLVLPLLDQNRLEIWGDFDQFVNEKFLNPLGRFLLKCLGENRLRHRNA